jgi:MFS transporter, CP family, cyanate transporter
MRSAPVARVVLLWLAGIDLRLTLLAVPPVIPLIHRELQLSEAGVAALSNLPVLTLAVSSMFGGLLTARLGARRAVIVGLWVIAISSALRGAGPSIPMLFAMTVVMGAGIAMIQPAFPSLARAWFAERIALGTGIWANGLLCGEAISASLTIPFVLPLVGGSWERSFVAWSVPVVVTALALMLVRDQDAGAGDRGTAWLPNFRDPRIWQLGTYQAGASLAYFGANTFLPDYLHATGQPGLVGAALAALNIGQIPASIVVGLVPMGVLGKRRTSYAVAALIVAALAGVLWLGGGFAVAGVALLGFCAAYVLTVSFALPALLAPREEVARLASGTFTLGYSISFVTTLLSGAAWDATHFPAIAFLPILSAALIVAVLGPRLTAAMERDATAAAT